jgi:signal transduction histidine kinase
MKKKTRKTSNGRPRRVCIDTRSEAEGRLPNQLTVPPGLFDEVSKATSAALKSGVTVYEILRRRSQRSSIYVDTIADGVPDQRTRTDSVVACKHNVAPLNARGDVEGLEARSPRDELDKAMKVKDEFLSVISHELKTPLIVLMQYANLLKDGTMGKVNEDQEKALVKLLGAAAEQLKMINMILQTTQLESGAPSLERKLIEVRDLLRSLEMEYQGRFTGKDLTLRWNYPAEPLELITDPVRLEQILRNLIDNAIKFTEHGSVTISANNCPEARKVRFAVVDTGIGIAKANHNAIFEKLYQVESSENRRYEGIGLGLYVVKKFSDLIGATVEVKSDLGMGSKFTLRVPWQ